MSAMEFQSVVNAVGGLPLVSGNQGVSDDQALVAKPKLGQDEAFAVLYKRHQCKAYSRAFRILRNQQDAEDAVQRAFQRAVVNLQRFREDSTFSTWLTRIVINEALMLLRQRRAQEPLHENNADPAQGDGRVEVADDGPTPEQILCESERREALLQAIGRLRKNLRIVVLHRE